MSQAEAPSLEFVLRRVDAANNNVNDVRRSMAALAARFEGLETRFSVMEARFAGLETRFAAMETRFGTMEGRMDAMMAILLELKER